ncbi:MAG: hypothetical protein HXS52_07395 [Theionarchaea archaeon]|nr:hypothetical protein [Theionarchaea archaeon]MBU7037741.1 hypothetical protein [Theionarchaea archaeon]
MAEEIRRLMDHTSARIYAGLAIAFLVVYTTLAIHEHFTGSDAWTLYYLGLGFGLFLLFFVASGRTMRQAIGGRKTR